MGSVGDEAIRAEMGWRDYADRLDVAMKIAMKPYFDAAPHGLPSEGAREMAIEHGIRKARALGELQARLTELDADRGELLRMREEAVDPATLALIAVGLNNNEAAHADLYAKISEIVNKSGPHA